MAHVVGEAARRRGHYSHEDFVKVCRWKSVRSSSYVARNSADAVVQATRTALADATVERERMRVLRSLHGVAFPIASVAAPHRLPRALPDPRPESAPGPRNAATARVQLPVLDGLRRHLRGPDAAGRRRRPHARPSALAVVEASTARPTLTQPSGVSRRAGPRGTAGRSARSAGRPARRRRRPRSRRAARRPRRGRRTAAARPERSRRTTRRSGRSRSRRASPASARCPVLPATWYPGIAAYWPVPSATTSFSIIISWPAIVRRDEPAPVERRPPAPGDVVDEVRPRPDAAVRDRRVRGRHLHGRDGDSLADRHVADRRAGPLVRREDDSRALAGEVDARRRARSRTG